MALKSPELLGRARGGRLRATCSTSCCLDIVDAPLRDRTEHTTHCTNAVGLSAPCAAVYVSTVRVFVLLRWCVALHRPMHRSVSAGCSACCVAQCATDRNAVSFMEMVHGRQFPADCSRANLLVQRIESTRSALPIVDCATVVHVTGWNAYSVTGPDGCVVHCLLHVVCCTLYAARCMLHVVCCTLCAACCMHSVACRMRTGSGTSARWSTKSLTRWRMRWT